MPAEIISRLGLKRVINAAGHYTSFGGSSPHPDVLEAMAEASKYWVDVSSLQERAGEELGRLLGCEDGFVTSGAYASNSLAVLASASLGRSRGREGLGVVIQEQHVTEYAASFEVGGARLRRVRRGEGRDRLQEHIEDSDVAVTYVVCKSEREFSLKETIGAARAKGIPVIVDAAVVDPPVPALRSILELGPDFVSVSGGKGFDGPNATGLLLGKAEAVRAARSLAFPNYGPGRGMKVSRESIVGALAAVSHQHTLDPDRTVERWKERAEDIAGSVSGVPGVTTKLDFPWMLNIPQLVPRLLVKIEEGRAGGAEGVRRKLLEGEPPILTRPPRGTSEVEGAVVFDVRTLREGEAEIVGERLRACLEGKA